MEKWNPKNFNTNFRMLLLAPSKGGKTNLIQWFVTKRLKNVFDRIIVFTNSTTKLRYEKFISEEDRIYDKYSPKKLEEILDFNAEHKQELACALKFLVIIDDLAGRNKLKQCKILTRVFTNGRHSNVSLMFSSQNSMFANTDWKTNANYTVIFKHKSRGMYKNIINNILIGSIDTTDSDVNETQFYLELLGVFTQDYHFILKDDDGLCYYRVPLMSEQSEQS